MNDSSDILKQIGIISNIKGARGTLIVTNCLSGLYLPADTTIKIGFSESFCKDYKLAQNILTHNKKTEIHILNINSREQAELLKEKAIFINKNIILKYNPNYIFEEEIIGSNAINIDTGASIGTIIEVWELPANDVWVVATENGNLPLPVIDDVIEFIDLENKIIKIHVIDGLMDIVTKN